MELISIKEVLSNPENNPDGGFYLPPNIDEWSLDTLGIFSEDSYYYPPDSTEYIPKQATEDGWIEALDNGSIEEVVENTKLQLSHYTIHHLFEAFVFYVKNDAFIDFSN
ncbi:hypothetical protein ISO77_18640 [Morganella morganii subsp. morganii]|uniref:DUF7716 domain-containing protein n=1 Tax=Morganella morganii TaxID=582 RepID=UPI001BDA0050|nr:hypothetical protein [Morganella morganii]MBT0397545.1 hypothetical protein [Morganella morganii subsp. morganii]